MMIDGGDGGGDGDDGDGSGDGGDDSDDSVDGELVMAATTVMMIMLLWHLVWLMKPIIFRIF